MLPAHSPVDLQRARDIHVEMHFDTLLEIKDRLGHAEHFIHLVEEPFLAGIGQVEVEKAVMDGGLEELPALRRDAIS